MRPLLGSACTAGAQGCPEGGRQRSRASVKSQISSAFLSWTWCPPLWTGVPSGKGNLEPHQVSSPCHRTYADHLALARSTCSLCGEQEGATGPGDRAAVWPSPRTWILRRWWWKVRRCALEGRSDQDAHALKDRVRRDAGAGMDLECREWVHLRSLWPPLPSGLILESESVQSGLG